MNTIVRRKANLVRIYFKKKFLLQDAIEEQMTEVKGVGRRRTQLLDDLRNIKNILGVKEGR